jgi:hypothetical protein
MATAFSGGSQAARRTHRPPTRHSPVAPLLTVQNDTMGRPIPPGFLGLSFEYPALVGYAGKNPAAPNPVLLQLIRGLNPGQAPVLRIGGVTTDHTWWPVAHMRQPRGVTYALTSRWLSVAATISRVLNAHMIFGVNFEADSRALAAAEARALLSAVGPRHVEGLELGNEPELYSTWPWYRTSRGAPVVGRGSDYGLAAFTRDYVKIADALPPAPLAGPAFGSALWMTGLPEVIAAAPRLRVVTLHRYPLLVCFQQPGWPEFPTIPNLLSPQSSAGLANSIAPYVALAHAHHLTLRIDEMNTISCGAVPAVGRSFAAALWALNTMFEMARVGVDGVNIHTYRGATDQLFKFRHASGLWSALVEPGYYGLLMFSRAAPPGASLLRIDGATTAGVHAWATRADNGTIRIVLINDDSRAGVVDVRVPGTARPALLERLRAPSISARTGVTLGGHGFGTSTYSGLLPRPVDTPLAAAGGRYRVELPAASATMLTILPPPAGSVAPTGRG